MRVVRTLPGWKDLLYKLWNSRDKDGLHVIGFDTETLDRGFPDVQIVGFSAAWYEWNQFGILDKNRAYVPVGHATGELQITLVEVVPGLKALLEDGSVEVTGQNLKYDAKVVRLLGIELTENVFDTLIASWLLNTNGVGSKLQVLLGEGEHGLKALSKHLLKKEMTELTELAPREKYTRGGVEFETLRVDLVPIEDQYDPVSGALVKKGIANYAGDDAERVLDLRELFKPQLDEDPRTRRVYYAIQREFIFVLVDMESFGVELDEDLLADMRVRIEAELVLVKESMYRQRRGEDFPAFADAALVKKFVEQWDEYEARFTLGKDHPNYPKKVVEKGPRGNKTTSLEPASKATVRKNLIDAFGLQGHPVVDKVRDDKLRPEVKMFPHLAHKIFNPSSVNELNKVLFQEQGLAPIGERGANGLFSTKAEYVEVWKNYGDPLAKELDRLREIDKLRGTYLVGMVALLSADRRLRGRMNQGGTRTGRLSMSDPNLQNQPNNKEFPIRQSFVAMGLTASAVTIHDWYLDDKGKKTKPKHLTVQALAPDDPKHQAWTARTGVVLDGGYEIREKQVVRWWGTRPPYVLFVGDYSQLEICLLAHESSDEKLVTAVKEGQDIHALTAQAVFDAIPKTMSLEDVKKNFPDLRKKAKPINFGILYGMGPQKLAGTLGISVEEAKDIIENRYMSFYVGVARWIQKMHTFAVANGFVTTAVGRKRHLPAAQLPRDGETLGYKNSMLISKAKRQAQNTPIQGLAADLVALAMRDLRRRFKSLVIQDLASEMLVGANGEQPTPMPVTLPGLTHWGAGPDELWGNWVRSLLQVHDELVQEAHPAVANWVATESVELMENAGGMSLRVPIHVDAALGTDWFLTKE